MRPEILDQIFQLLGESWWRYTDSMLTGLKIKPGNLIFGFKANVSRLHDILYMYG